MKNNQSILSQKRIRSSERGQSLVELGVTLVILLVLLAGIADLGRIFLAVMVMRDSAQEAATYGIMEPGDCAGIVDRAKKTASTSNFGPGEVQVSVTMEGAACASASAGTQACGGNELKVTVTQPSFPIVTPFIGAIIGGQSIPLNSTIADTILRPPCN